MTLGLRGLASISGGTTSPSDAGMGSELQAMESAVRVMAVSVATIRCWRQGSLHSNLLNLDSDTVASLIIHTLHAATEDTPPTHSMASAKLFP